MKFDAPFELEWKLTLRIENQKVHSSWTAVAKSTALKIKQPLIKCSVVPQSFGRELLSSSQLKHHHHLIEICQMSFGLVNSVCLWCFSVTYPQKLCHFIFISFSYSNAPTCLVIPVGKTLSPPEQCVPCQCHGYSSNEYPTEYKEI